MSSKWQFLFYLLSAGSFGLAAFAPYITKTFKVNLVALGLLFWVLVPLYAAGQVALG